MRRIVILTQPLHTNYGGMLQAYALQRVLRDMGHRVVTDSHRNSLARRVVPWWCRNVVVDIIRRLVNVIRGVTPHYALVERVGGNFTRFMDTHISTIELFDRNGSVNRRYLKEFDTYVVGSDQTWRPSCNVNEIFRYYLDFVQTEGGRRVAYAASFGVDNLAEYSEDMKLQARALISRFDAVSLREKSGVDMCRSEFGVVDCCQVLDPTMLLRREDYEALVGDISSVGRGVGLYLLDRREEVVTLVESLSQDMSSPSFDIGLNYSSIEEWISSFRDADYIVTDSFHGTLFAILFERKFVTVVNHQRGASRFESLLAMVGLESRMVECSAKSEEVCDLLGREIDYVEVGRRVEKLRRQSLEFLENSLK